MIFYIGLIILTLICIKWDLINQDREIDRKNLGDERAKRNAGFY